MNSEKLLALLNKRLEGIPLELSSTPRLDKQQFRSTSVKPEGFNQSTMFTKDASIYTDQNIKHRSSSKRDMTATPTRRDLIDSGFISHRNSNSSINNGTEPKPSKNKYYEFVDQLYTDPVKAKDIFTKSFVSFKDIAYFHGPKIKINDDENRIAFMKSSQATSWKKQLEFNKSQEGIYKKAVRDTVITTNQNFYNLVRIKQRRTGSMPQIKISSPERKPIKINLAVEAYRRGLNGDYSALNRGVEETKNINKEVTYSCYCHPPSNPHNYKPEAREGAGFTVVGDKAYLYGGVSKEIYNKWEVLDLSNYYYVYVFNPFRCFNVD